MNQQEQSDRLENAYGENLLESAANLGSSYCLQECLMWCCSEGEKILRQRELVKCVKHLVIRQNLCFANLRRMKWRLTKWRVRWGLSYLKPLNNWWSLRLEREESSLHLSLLLTRLSRLRLKEAFSTDLIRWRGVNSTRRRACHVCALVHLIEKRSCYYPRRDIIQIGGDI